jgi:hypothetical protein
MERIVVKLSAIRRLFRIAFALAIFTVSYNFAEGFISVYFAFQEESIVLFAFGVYGLVEILWGFGIAVSIGRDRSGTTGPTNYERMIFRIAGFAFYTLAIGLSLIAIFYLYNKQAPEGTFLGVIIGMISTAVMSGLTFAKNKIGRLLRSDGILDDANSARGRIYTSALLLLSSVGYELTQLLYVQIIGALALAYFSSKRGKSSFEKANARDLVSDDVNEKEGGLNV